MISRIAVAGLLLSIAACANAPDKRAVEPKPVVQVDTEALLAAADATRIDGRFTEAVQIYQEVLVADARSVAAQYGTAECLLGLGRARDAQSIFAGLAKDSQFGILSLQGLGLADLALNKREEAARALHEAVAADQKLWRALNGLALIADLKRRPDEAADLYDRALAVNPDSAVLLNNRGYSRLLAGRADEAIADLRGAIALEPDSETIQNNLRIAVAARGNYAEATRNVPRDKMPMVLNNVGYVAMRRGDLTTADGLLARARADNPNYDAVTAHNLDELNALKGGAK